MAEFTASYRVEVRMSRRRFSFIGFGTLWAAFLALTLAAFLPAPTHAQTTAPPLTNDDVIKMVQAKLPDAVVVAKIRTSPCKFDTSPDTLIKLKRAGVSDPVLQAMTESAAPTPAPPANPVPPALGSREAATVLVPGLPSQFGAYYKDPDKGWVALEQAPAERIMTKGGGRVLLQGGFGSIKSVQVYTGAEAPVQIHESTPVFYVRGLAASGRGIVIVRMDKKKDQRELQVGSAGAFSSNAGYKPSDLRHVAVAHISNDVVSVVPKTGLDSGEYALDLRAGIYDFGIKRAQ
jgi:hypothetical protein